MSALRIHHSQLYCVKTVMYFQRLDTVFAQTVPALAAFNNTHPVSVTLAGRPDEINVNLMRLILLQNHNEAQ